MAKLEHIWKQLKCAVLLILISVTVYLLLSNIAFRIKLELDLMPAFNDSDAFRRQNRFIRKSALSGDIVYAPKDRLNLAQSPNYGLFQNMRQSLESNIIIHDFKSNIGNLDMIECVPTSTEPSVEICIYPKYIDGIISQSIEKNGAWERQLSDRIMDTLASYSGAGFIDIGANLGVHSLRVARSGRSVVAVEPMRAHILRLHKSVLLNNLTNRYTLVENAISNERNTVTLYNAWRNLGGNTLDRSLSVDQPRRETVRTVFMDDLLEVMPFQEAIMKIDIEGSEHKAFAKATRMFQKVNIHCIFMEWQNMKRLLESSSERNESTQLINNMLQFLEEHGYHAYSYSQGGYTALQTNNTFNWPMDIVWKKL